MGKTPVTESNSSCNCGPTRGPRHGRLARSATSDGKIKSLPQLDNLAAILIRKAPSFYRCVTKINQAIYKFLRNFPQLDALRNWDELGTSARFYLYALFFLSAPAPKNLQL
jgi:hypothetical protein